MQLTKKDFTSDQEVRWCPGCGDYAILAAVQSFMPELGLKRENIVFVSGIGCAARFPYYMETYGMHSIHGRAPAIATGLSVSRPDLSVWVVTGDGDSMSIGGNHLIHALRRNVNLKILMFNNRIYGLTKGQYSPTSELGKVTKSTPMGSLDHPFNPLSLAIGAEATFVARAIDTDKKELTEVLRAAAHHKGSAFVEIYQNCNIYNDGAFDFVREEKENRLYLRARRADRVGRQGRAAAARRLTARSWRRREPGPARARRARARAGARVRALPDDAAGDRRDPDGRLPRGRPPGLRRADGEQIGVAKAKGEGELAALLGQRRHLDDLESPNRYAIGARAWLTPLLLTRSSLVPCTAHSPAGVLTEPTGFSSRRRVRPCSPSRRCGSGSGTSVSDTESFSG